MNIINVELAAMVDFEFRPGQPPQQLAEQLASVDAANAAKRRLEDAAEGRLRRQGSMRPDHMAMSDLSRSHYSPQLALQSHPATGGTFALPWSQMRPIAQASNFREAWSDRIEQLREAWSNRALQHSSQRFGPMSYEGLSPDPAFGFDYLDDPKLQILARDYSQSEPWLWYESEWLGRGEAPLFRQRRRLFLTAPKEYPEAIGIQVLLLPQRGAGVATVWMSNQQWRKDPWEAKHSIWGKEDYWRRLLAPTGLLDETELSSERNYVFVAARVDATDLTDFCHNESAKIVSWFTGGYEHESFDRQVELVSPENNISNRGYERLFMRWTDALALYNLDVVRNEDFREDLRRGANPAAYWEGSDLDYRLVRCRAAQLFEHCILARRIFRTDSRRIARLSTHAGLIRSAPVVSKNWRQANAVLSAFSQAEFEMVTAPPIRSVEAETLVRTAIERCGIPALVNDTRRGYDLLERRLQWARGQWLALIAVCAFVANALIALIH